MTILVTRPEADAAATIRRLAARGYTGLSAPGLVVAPVAGWHIPDNPAALVLTSRNAAVSLSNRTDLSDFRDIPVLCVGDKTADAARAAGFSSVRSAGGTVTDLMHLVAATCSRDGGPIIYLSGRAVSEDLDETLEDAGFDTRRIVVYDAVPAQALPVEAVEAIRMGQIDAVLFYSPRSVGAVSALAASAGVSDALSGIPAVTLSDRVAAAAKKSGYRHIFVARTPQESDLLIALDTAVATTSD